MAAAAGASSTASDRFVLLDTTAGKISVELFPSICPTATRNFVELARRNYYDGTTFHRVIRGFILQGGDPTGTGKGGQSAFGRPFADEITPRLRHTGAGILCMANSGPNTNGSQFFITLAPAPHLDGKHTIFGRISSGMDVVERIGSVECDGNDRPLDPTSITKTTVHQADPL